MSRRSLALRCVSFSLAAVVFTACSETVSSPHEISSEPSTTAVADSLAEARRLESATVERVAKALALSLADATVRRALYEEIRNRGLGGEKKILPRDFFADSSTSLVAFKLRASVALEGARLNDEIAKVRELEMYIPVRQQRDSWDGSRSILVAFQLGEHTPIISFDHNGNRSVLSESAPPSDVVLALVPREFKASQTEGRFPNTAKLLACDDPEYPNSPSCTGGGGGAPPDSNGDGIPDSFDSGLYLTYANISDLMEPWIKGDPEIEAFVLGPKNTDPATRASMLSCSDQASVELVRRFDQNSHTWSGVALVFSQAQATSFGLTSASDRNIHIHFYEDDHNGCEINDDPTKLVAVSWGMAAASLLVWFDPDSGFGELVGTAFLDAWGIGSWIEGMDDDIGVAVGKASVPGYSDSATSHALVIQANPSITLNGGVKLVAHTKIP